MVKFPTGAETSMMASIVSAVIWPLVTKLVAMRLVTVGSIEAAPYPFVGPLENICYYPRRKKKRGIYANSSLREFEVCEVRSDDGEPLCARR